MSDHKFYHFSATGIYYAVESLQAAIDASVEGGFIWLNYYKPNKEDLNVLVNKMGIHPLYCSMLSVIKRKSSS
jgi:Mg2+ and Co2+ transporter CorA